jgi:thymidylate kinase
MFICVDGISGVGKSTMLSDLQDAAVKRGLQTSRFHFFSGIRPDRGRMEEDARALERSLFEANTTRAERGALFRRLCELACEHLARVDVSHTDITLVERSPIAYYAYSQALLGTTPSLWPSFYETVAALNPIVVTMDVEESLQRTESRGLAKRQDFIHNLTSEDADAVQCAFIGAAILLGAEHCDASRVHASLLARLPEGQGATRRRDSREC